jgi:hypothetical protein
MTDPGSLFCVLVIGLWWGQWLTERRAKKTADRESPAFRLLYEMVQSIREKRRFVGPYMSITRDERFEFLGEKFTLSLRAEGDPNAVAESDAA